MLCAESSAEAGAGPAVAAVLPGVVDRARRLRGEASERLLPSDPRGRSAAALRIHREMPGRRARRERQRDRGSLQLRPEHQERHAGCRCAQGQRQHSLALRAARVRVGCAAVRPAVYGSAAGPRPSHVGGRNGRWRRRPERLAGLAPGERREPDADRLRRRCAIRRADRAQLPRRPEQRIETRRARVCRILADAGAPGGALPVRAPWLLHRRRRGSQPRAPGVQSRGHAARRRDRESPAKRSRRCRLPPSGAKMRAWSATSQRMQ